MKSVLLAPATAFALLLAALAAPAARAQQGNPDLPDMGSSAKSLLTPFQERLYGEQTRRQLRRAGLLIEDPLLQEWLDHMAYTLVANSNAPQEPFTFFVVRSRDINAFATLGGYVGLNAGLILAAHREDEVAAVLAHEIAHHTQRHVLRQVEKQQQNTIPLMLGMLAAVIAAQSSGSPDATQAAVATGTGLMQQLQINNTRESEHEADRLGIFTAGRAGYDPEAMADFFGREFRSSNPYGITDLLRDHPVTTLRISEARDRARQIAQQREQMAAPLQAAEDDPQHPLLPEGMMPPPEMARQQFRHDPEKFAWMAERLRVLSARNPAEGVNEYRRMFAAEGAEPNDAQRYGYALARLRADRPGEALPDLRDLADRHPGDLWVALALAEAEMHSGLSLAAQSETKLGAGLIAQSLARYEGLRAALPEHRGVALAHAQALISLEDAGAARKAQGILRSLAGDPADSAAYQETLARASLLAGDELRASEAYAEVAYLSGRPHDAVAQLRALLAREDLDYVARARIEASIAAITPILLEMEKRGLIPGHRAPPQG